MTAVADSAGATPTRKLRRHSGPDRIAALLRAGFRPTAAKRRLAGGSPTVHAAVVNGAPAVVATLGDRVLGVVVLTVRDERIAAVCGIADPTRLGRLTEQWRRLTPADPLIAAW